MQKRYQGVVLGGDHWHLQSHVRHLKTNERLSESAELVAISGTGRQSRAVAEEFQIPIYPDPLELLGKHRCDFAYVFSTHRHSPELINHCVSQGLPFIAEKPCAVRPEILEPIARLAESRNIPHVVPLWRRYAPIVLEYRKLIRTKVQSGPLHFLFRYVTGSPERYRTLDCAWAVTRSDAGGGALMNLGSHYIDLFRYLTGEEVVRVRAQINKSIWDTDVDDFAVLVLESSGGSSATIEVGYTNPGPPYELYEVSGKGFILRGEPGVGTQLVEEDGTVVNSKFPGGNRYDLNLLHLIDMIEARPVADECTLADQLECVRVIDAAYRDADF